MIQIQLLQLKNGNWMITLLYCSNLFFVTKECSKNNALLSSIIPHAKLLTKFVNYYESSEKASDVCKILAKNIGEACVRRFYTNNNNLNMNDNKLLLVTTAVDPRYRLSAFPSYLKNNVKELLKLEVKKHICFKADQSSEFPTLPPEKQNHNLLQILIRRSFQLIILCLKQKQTQLHRRTNNRILLKKKFKQK